ncbi:MAG: efflux RND transporter periplasmic adaptor subunit [Phycisphaeraceae bacterium]
MNASSSTSSQASSRLTPVWVLLAALGSALLAAGLTYVFMQPPDGGGPNGAGGGPGGGGGGPGGGGPPPATVRLGEADMREVQRKTSIVGQFEPVQRATIAAEAEGRVLRVTVEEGDRIDRDKTVIAEIDEVFTALELEAAEADVQAAEATLSQSESDLAELEELAERNSATEREVADQRARVKSDRAMLRRSIAERDRAAEQVKRLKVIAPFDGVVIAKLTEVGQWLDPGSPVIEAISRGEVDAVIDVSERYVNALSVGQEMEVIVDALDERFTGTLISINPRGAEAARTFPIEVRLHDENGLLKPGMSMTAEVPLSEESELLTVPRDAVRFTPQGAQVWAAVSRDDEPPVAVPLPVEVLFGVGDRFAVEPGPAATGEPLSAGSRVVVEGAERLFPNRPLEEMDSAEQMMREAGERDASPEAATDAQRGEEDVDQHSQG